jgi:cysteinyl-tRNA synthetase
MDAQPAGQERPMDLKLYDTLTREKRVFEPLDPARVRMYVCGPTVYDFAHIGNARPVVVFDVLFRLLRHLYGADHVVYVRNITDVDDKINARAAERGVAIRELTEETYRYFKEDVAALGCLPPTVEPRATEHIEQMTELIERLIAAGNAYVADGHVLFHVPSMPDYGRLSKRPLDEMIAGARVDVAPYKRDPMDFVLWKPSKPGEPAWRSPAGIAAPGRPGWHIECSAMAWKHLGETFDIHGGGIDLVFPHHENEIAQSRCAFHTPLMARTWMHNGFLQVEGEKMAKSAGNFVTIRELLENWQGIGWPGEALRFNMLRTHYRQPIDWTFEGLDEAHKILWDWYGDLENVVAHDHPPSEIVESLCDDLNTPQSITELHKVKNRGDLAALKSSLRFLGFSGVREKLGRKHHVRVTLGVEQRIDASATARQNVTVQMGVDASEAADRMQEKADISSTEEGKRLIDALVLARNAARKARNFAEADRIRDVLMAENILLKDNKDGTTTWEKGR